MQTRIENPATTVPGALEAFQQLGAALSSLDQVRTTTETEGAGGEPAKPVR
jgi:hypothetical protein